MTSVFVPPLPSELSGAIVARAFNSDGGKRHLQGEFIASDILATYPRANFCALVENRFLKPVPIPMEARAGGGCSPAPLTLGTADNSSPPVDTVRRAFQIGFGRYVVMEGIVLADKVTKGEAEVLFAEGPNPDATKFPKSRTRPRHAEGREPGDGNGY